MSDARFRVVDGDILEFDYRPVASLLPYIDPSLRARLTEALVGLREDREEIADLETELADAQDRIALLEARLVDGPLRRRAKRAEAAP